MSGRLAGVLASSHVAAAGSVSVVETTSNGASNGDAVDLTFASSPGDLVLIGSSVGAQPASVVGPSSSSGWTALVNSDGFAVFWKVMPSPTEATVTMPEQGGGRSGNAHALIVLSGANSTSPIHNSASSMNAATPDPPSVTTVNNGAVVTFCGARAVQVSTAPTGYTNFTSAYSVDTNRGAIAMAVKTGMTGATEDPGEFTGDTPLQSDLATISITP